MPYFAIQVRSRAEARYIALAKTRDDGMGESLFFLRRSLRVKKGGAWREETAPIFSGYVFL